MTDISLGAVGAALIAGLVSLLGLIIGKEQKISDFRQAWIEDLRKCLVSYLVNINSIADTLLLEKSGEKIDQNVKINQYKSLNEANHGILFRINSKEKTAKSLIRAMKEFEGLAQDNDDITSEKIKIAEKKFTEASKRLLKFEWNRVKRGEATYFITKCIAAVLVSFLILFFIYGLFNQFINNKALSEKTKTDNIEKLSGVRRNNK